MFIWVMIQLNLYPTKPRIVQIFVTALENNISVVSFYLPLLNILFALEDLMHKELQK